MNVSLSLCYYYMFLCSIFIYRLSAWVSGVTEITHFGIIGLCLWMAFCILTVRPILKAATRGHTITPVLRVSDCISPNKWHGKPTQKHQVEATFALVAEAGGGGGGG